MQEYDARLEKSNLQAYCSHKSVLNRKVSMFRCCNMKKLNLILKLKSSDTQRINLTFVPYSLVANFVSYISAKYYLNWFSFHAVTMKVIGVNFFLKHSVEMTIQLRQVRLRQQAPQQPSVGKSTVQHSIVHAYWRSQTWKIMSHGRQHHPRWHIP